MRLAAAGDSKPTSQAYAVKHVIGGEIENQLSLLNTVWDDQLPRVNAMILDIGIDLIAIPSE